MKELLKKWQEFHTKTDEHVNKVSDLFGTECFDGEFFQNSFKLQEAYTELLEKHLNLDDQNDKHGGLLTYFAYECNFGKSPRKVIVNEKTFTLKDLDTLNELIKEITK